MEYENTEPGTPGYAPPVPSRTSVADTRTNQVRQSRDRAQYTRQQKGHSLILNLLIIGPLTLWITTIYISVSPNHYWHA